MFRFERLLVWQKAVTLYDLADQAADRFPQRMQFSMCTGWRKKSPRC